MAKFQAKKSSQHYVGVVLQEVENELGKTVYLGQFMRRNVDGSFSFPSQNDQCFVDLEDIVQVLREPMVTRRKTYLFNDLNVAHFLNLK